MHAQTLAGIRVIDATSVLAGPYATYQLALLGAEVIKIEKPGVGDFSRAGGEPLGDSGLNAQYAAQNAGKRAIGIDLSRPRGAALVRRLVGSADVFVENFAPGTIAAYGLDYATLRAERPGLVYCSISGYGQDGPLSRRPAYDHVIQAASGIMSLTGSPETAPLRIGPPMVDYLSGIYAAFAILAALRERDRTGNGQHVDVAMLDCALTAMASFGTAVLNAGADPRPSGNTAASGSPASGVFDTAQGKLAIAANQEKQVRGLCRVLGVESLLEDPRFAQPGDRATHRAAFGAEISQALRTRSALEWESALAAARVPASEVRSLRETLESDHVAARQTYVPTLAGTTTLKVPGAGFKLNGEPLQPSRGPRTLGADTEAVLREAGLSAGEIAQLRGEQVI